MVGTQLSTREDWEPQESQKRGALSPPDSTAAFLNYSKKALEGGGATSYGTTWVHSRVYNCSLQLMEPCGY